MIKIEIDYEETNKKYYGYLDGRLQGKWYSVESLLKEMAKKIKRME